jgi:regulatory protein
MYQNSTYTFDEAKKKLEHYCAYQERCHQEVRQLLKHNFLNEERFAKTFVRGKFKIKKWGKYRLTSELKKRDISKHNINLAISQIPNYEYIEVFNALADKKGDSLLETNKLKKKKKLVDYLLYRGWESHLVYTKVNELIP